MNWWALLCAWLLVNALFVILRTPVRRARHPDASKTGVSRS